MAVEYTKLGGGESNLPSPIAFDHAKILSDYFRFKKTGKRPL
ncbi:MAG: hypothetical protein ACYC7K_05565 [Desulfobacteria bacterium]